MVASRNVKVTLYNPHPGQFPIHRSLARFRVVPCGRRFGKTLLGCNELAKFCCEHEKKLGCWVAPTYRQTKIAYKLIKTALQPIMQHSSDSELMIELINGTRMMFCSADNYDALRGFGIHFLVLDECADINEKAWTEVLRPTLSDTRGKALFLGTPKGRNFFHTLYHRGLDPAYPEWESFTAPTSANPYIPREEIEAARQELPEMVYQQEYLAIFLAESAGVFTGIDGCIAGEFVDPDPNCSYVIGWDPAKYRDYSVLTVLNTATMHVDYWERSNQVDYAVQLGRAYELAERYNYAYVLQDSTGVGDPLLEQLQRRGLRAEGYLFTNASKKILIETLAVGIQHHNLTFPDLPVLIQELRQMEYTMTPSRLIAYGAPQGAHDDTVMSLALAYYAAAKPRVPLSGEPESTPEEEKPLIQVIYDHQRDPFKYAESLYGGEW